MCLVYIYIYIVSCFSHASQQCTNDVFGWKYNFRKKNRQKSEGFPSEIHQEGFPSRKFKNAFSAKDAEKTHICCLQLLLIAKRTPFKTTFSVFRRRHRVFEETLTISEVKQLPEVYNFWKLQLPPEISQNKNGNTREK